MIKFCPFMTATDGDGKHTVKCIGDDCALYISKMKKPLCAITHLANQAGGISWHLKCYMENKDGDE